MVNIFNRNRVSNVTASTVIIFTLYSVVFQTVPLESLAILTGLSGFASKHLFDSLNSKANEQE